MPPQTRSGAFFCSRHNAQVREPLHGTAPSADVWLLLEYAGRWGSKAFKESALADEVKAHLAAQQEAMPGSRLMFVKQTRPTGQQRKIHFFVCVAKLPEPRLYAFELARRAELLDLDIQAVAAGDAGYEASRRDERLFLACTNGKRDACCAKFGRPVYDALAQAAGDAAWQSTHIGGHRFAPNLLLLPHGLAYGRVTPPDAGRLVDAYRAGHIVLEHYRGRTIYSQPVQAAEVYACQQTGTSGVAAFRLLDVQEDTSHQWSVRFASADGGQVTVRVAEEPWPEPVYSGCSADAPGPTTTFRLVSLHTA